MENVFKIYGNLCMFVILKKRKVFLIGLFNIVLIYVIIKEFIEMLKGLKKINIKVVLFFVNVVVMVFEKFVDNINCFVMILYRGGFMSKVKYNSVLSLFMYKIGVDGKKERCRLFNGVFFFKCLFYKDFM